MILSLFPATGSISFAADDDASLTSVLAKTDPTPGAQAGTDDNPIAAETNEAGTHVTVTFDKAMADPTGKHEQFFLKDNSSKELFIKAERGDENTKIVLEVDGTPLWYGTSLKLTYKKGDIAAEDGGILEGFTDKEVKNNIPLGKITFNTTGDTIEMSSDTAVSGVKNTYVLTLSKGMPKASLETSDVVVTNLPAGLTYSVSSRLNIIYIEVSGTATSPVNTDATNVTVVVKATAFIDATAQTSDPVSTLKVKKYVAPALGRITFDVTDDSIQMSSGTEVGADNTYELRLNKGTPKDGDLKEHITLAGLPAGLTFAAEGKASEGTITITVSGTASPAVSTDVDNVTVTVESGAVSEFGAMASDSVSSLKVKKYVAPPAPTFVSAETNAEGTEVIVTFSKAMSAPTDKQHLSFSLNDGVERPFEAAKLGDTNTKIVLTVYGAPIAHGKTLKLTYFEAGSVAAADGGILEAFVAQPITNRVPAPHTGGTTDSGSADTYTPAPTPVVPGPKFVAPKANIEGQTLKVEVQNGLVAAVLKNVKDVEQKGIDIKVESNGKAKDVNVRIPKSAANAIANAKAKEVRISTPVVSATFDLKAVREIDAQTQDYIELVINRVDASTLMADAKAFVGSRPAFDLKLMTKSGKFVSEFKGVKVTVGIPYTPVANEDVNQLTVYYIADNGDMEEVPGARFDQTNKLFVFSTEHFSVYAIGEKMKPVMFDDIETHWAKAHIAYVFRKGLMKGTGETTFAPNHKMTRGMFVTVIGRLAGVDPDLYTNHTFADVKSDQYYAPYVAWAAEKGIVQGFGETNFRPDATITREQMAKIMAAYAKFAQIELRASNIELTFADEAQISGWAKEAVLVMQKAGILSGKGNNIFDPQGHATRAEVAKMIRALMQFQ